MTQPNRPVRTRFAPSPTGYLHIGNIRTVLFDWLLARHHGGQFILRIEDTDRKRYVPGAEELVFRSMRMLGLEWDEGPDMGGPHAPYRQSERLEIYHQYAEDLEQRGVLYRCYCTPERLEQLNKEKQALGQTPGYDRRCRNLTAEERAAHEAKGEPYVLRMAVPSTGETVVQDFLRGAITIRNQTLNDMVMIKSDSFPVYHFAVVIDDHLMEISHVLRGDEWIATAPYHILLYQALGWEVPALVHLPQVLGSNGKKLSKRHGDTAINWYIEEGYLPEALINFLALIGWSYDETTELMTREELIERFSLERIHPAGGVFSLEKLDWFNGVYIRKLSPEELTERVIPYLQHAGLIATPVSPEQRSYILQLIPLIQERLRVLREAPDQLALFFQAPEAYPLQDLIPKKLDRAQTIAVLESVQARLDLLDTWSEQLLEEQLRALATEHELKTGVLFMIIRVAVSGRAVSPPLFGMLSILGKEETLSRLKRASDVLRATVSVETQ